MGCKVLRNCIKYDTFKSGQNELWFFGCKPGVVWRSGEVELVKYGGVDMGQCEEDLRQCDGLYRGQCGEVDQELLG